MTKNVQTKEREAHRRSHVRYHGSSFGHPGAVVRTMMLVIQMMVRLPPLPIRIEEPPPQGW